MAFKIYKIVWELSAFKQRCSSLPLPTFDIQQMTGFQGPKKVVISSKKYDIHKETLNLDILNRSALSIIL
jgi:hypothetical protein